VYRPNIASKTHLLALPDYLGRLAATEYSHAGRAEQSFQAHGTRKVGQDQ